MYGSGSIDTLGTTTHPAVQAVEDAKPLFSCRIQRRKLPDAELEKPEEGQALEVRVRKSNTDYTYE
jgi:hypothetical protein